MSLDDVCKYSNVISYYSINSHELILIYVVSNLIQPIQLVKFRLIIWRYVTNNIKSTNYATR